MRGRRIGLLFTGWLLWIGCSGSAREGVPSTDAVNSEGFIVVDAPAIAEDAPIWCTQVAASSALRTSASAVLRLANADGTEEARKILRTAAADLDALEDQPDAARRAAGAIRTLANSSDALSQDPGEFTAALEQLDDLARDACGFAD